MDSTYLKKHHLFLLNCISGSRAYGLQTPTSDTDYRGVFVAPMDKFYSLSYPEQVNNETNDITYFELKKFVELLSKNNPNILELLHTPEDCILYKHPLFEKFTAGRFLSRLCKNTFAGYAMTQVKKARGLNKKILNPLPKERKNILDFCYVTVGQGSMELEKWLEKSDLKQEQCGLVNIPNMRDMYALFYDTAGTLDYKGIMRKEESNEVALSSVPQQEKPVIYLNFNRDGYSSYCKRYKEYWVWVGKRNEDRYQGTLSHGKGFDAKNMMHTFRLLDMAEEIATRQEIIVRRPNREFLLKIKAGEFTYEDLVKMAEERIEKMEELYEKSDLPAIPDVKAIETLLIEVREAFYKEHK